jgi:hypothetical protein
MHTCMHTCMHAHVCATQAQNQGPSQHHQRRRHSTSGVHSSNATHSVAPPVTNDDDSSDNRFIKLTYCCKCNIILVEDGPLTKPPSLAKHSTTSLSGSRLHSIAASGLLQLYVSIVNSILGRVPAASHVPGITRDCCQPAGLSVLSNGRRARQVMTVLASCCVLTD